MAWYRTGTVSITNGLNSVTGSGTAWLSNARVGDAFVGPDGKMYEINGIPADDSMSVYPAYVGASASGQSYATIPVPGYTKKLADEAAELINSYDDALQKPWNAADDATDARTALELGNAATRNAGYETGELPTIAGFRSDGTLSYPSVDSVNDVKWNSAYLCESSLIGGLPPGNTHFYVITFVFSGNQWARQIAIPFYPYVNTSPWHRHFDSSNNVWSSWSQYLTNSNTTLDSNGFVKAASPIINLYADEIEMNDEAKQQQIELVVNGIGDYTITGTSGFAQEGWYIETPTDANKNVKCYTEYEQIEQEDGTYNTNVNTYIPDYSTGPAKAGEPCDITSGRFISIRLQPLPTPEPELEPAPEESPTSA